jgi:Pentapeptide repeats (8 copies)
MSEQFDIQAFQTARQAQRKVQYGWKPAEIEMLTAYKAGERDFSGADLSHTDLRSADLRSADLSRADLVGADLSRANLRSANLSRANLGGANLGKTCLDPNTTVPDTRQTLFAAFELQEDSRYLIGYRTDKSVYTSDNTYEPGKTYTAPFFSVDPNTSCHPGLYFSTLDEALRLAEEKNMRVIRVRVELAGALAVGNKFRCKSFTVLDYVA